MIESSKGERSVEETYSRKTPLEHVLLRPGMYVGAVERLPPHPCWVVDRTFPLPPPSSNVGRTSTSTLPNNSLMEHQPMKMVRKDYGIIPALIKVFDEILVNASDNRLRHPDSCSAIDVIIDAGANDRDPFISIFNDGKGVPIEVGAFVVLVPKHEDFHAFFSVQRIVRLTTTPFLATCRSIKKNSYMCRNYSLAIS
jgi:DNA topoisomerase-2